VYCYRIRDALFLLLNFIFLFLCPYGNPTSIKSSILILLMRYIFISFFNGSAAPWGPRPPHFSRLHDHTFRHTTLGGTPLGK
jgi:hypothetical protein